MLELEIPGRELFNEQTEEFEYSKPMVLRLEHSLVSISKWEAKYQRPFLKPNQRFSVTEERDYIRFMTLNQHVDPIVYHSLSNRELSLIHEYIENPMSATTFNEPYARPDRQIMTSELLYYYMTVFNIPIEAQKWHLNRLLTLIRICTIKSNKDQKMSTAQIQASNHKLNQQRRKMRHSKG